MKNKPTVVIPEIRRVVEVEALRLHKENWAEAWEFVGAREGDYVVKGPNGELCIYEGAGFEASHEPSCVADASPSVPATAKELDGLRKDFTAGLAHACAVDKMLAEGGPVAIGVEQS